MRLARCDRLDELMGFHDLEVVVTHRDARGGLEPSKITVARCHEVSEEGRVLVVLIEAQLQFTHPPEGERAPRAVHVDAIAALLANRGSAGLEYPEGAHAKAQQCCRVVLVLNSPDRAARCAREVGR